MAPRDLLAQMAQLETDNYPLKQKLATANVHLEDNIKDSDISVFIRDSPNVKCSQAGWHPGTDGKNIILAYTANDNHSAPAATGRPRKLSPSDQFFMYLVRVRLCLLETDLSYRFGVSVYKYSRSLVSDMGKLPLLTTWQNA